MVRTEDACEIIKYALQLTKSLKFVSLSSFLLSITN